MACFLVSYERYSRTKSNSTVPSPDTWLKTIQPEVVTSILGEVKKTPNSQHGHVSNDIANIKRCQLQNPQPWKEWGVLYMKYVRFQMLLLPFTRNSSSGFQLPTHLGQNRLLWKRLKETPESKMSCRISCALSRDLNRNELMRNAQDMLRQCGAT